MNSPLHTNQNINGGGGTSVGVMALFCTEHQNGGIPMARWWQSEMASAVEILYVHPTYPPTCPNNIDVKSPVKTQTLLRTEYHPKPTEWRNFLWRGGGSQR